MTGTAFTQAETEHLASQSLARLATVGANGQPDLVPVAVEFDAVGFWICGAGEAMLRTRKVRNVAAGRRRVGLVVDDLVAVEPFVARGIRIYGEAEPPGERVGMVGRGYLRVTPTVSWSRNMGGEPAGDEWLPHASGHPRSRVNRFVARPTR